MIAQSNGNLRISANETVKWHFSQCVIRMHETFITSAKLVQWFFIVILVTIRDSTSWFQYVYVKVFPLTELNFFSRTKCRQLGFFVQRRRKLPFFVWEKSNWLFSRQSRLLAFLRLRRVFGFSSPGTSTTDFLHTARRYVPPASLVPALPLGGAPFPYGLTYLSKPAWGVIGALVDGHQQLPNFIQLNSYCDYFDKLLRLENDKLFSRQDKILNILVTTIFILYRKLYLNIETIQYQD